METTAPKACCLDCRHCKLKAGWYGTTRYWCTLNNRTVDSSRVLLEACDRYVNWRRAPAGARRGRSGA